MNTSFLNFLKKFSLKRGDASVATDTAAGVASGAGKVLDIDVLMRAKTHGLISPKRDWKIMFVAFVMMALVFAGLSIYLFLKIDKGEIFTATGQYTGSARVIDAKLLADAVAQFEAKKETLRALEQGALGASDPSL